MDLQTLLSECAPTVAPATMARVIRHESGLRPLAIGINGGTRLKRQPRSAPEATAWARWLLTNGYNIDLGLAQINYRNLERVGLTLETVFEPCANVRAGALILTENYRDALKRYKDSQEALRAALSAYNTGRFESGIGRAYVGKVAAIEVPDLMQPAPRP